jgi:3D (Asp-Asp-Asp) domain-containing protein
MAKSLFGGGAALTGALLLSSLIFNVHPSVAENLAPLDSTQQTSQQKNATGVDPFGKALSSETVSVPDGDAPNLLNAAAATLKSSTLARSSGKSLTGSINPSALFENYTATAYSLAGRTASGAGVRRGLIAADHRVFPLGTRVRIDAGSYSGEYLVADRGSAVRGHTVDIWVPSTREAMRFGRRPVRLTVLSYGARPATSANRSRR